MLYGYDGWVVKVDSEGVVQWDKTYGGDRTEVIRTAVQIDDGFILGGSSNSNAGWEKSEDCRCDSTSSHSDFWVLKIDENGVKIWDKTFGGALSDGIRSIVVLEDGYLLCGVSKSSAGFDKTAPGHDLTYDYWVVKIDFDGNKIWDKDYGAGIAVDSTIFDEEPQDVLSSATLLKNSTVVLAGWSNCEADGDKTENSIGYNDYWIVCIDTAGNKLWDRTYGGSENQYAHACVATLDTGVVIAGISNSPNDGNKTRDLYFPGYFTYWALKLGAQGDTVWQRVYGGGWHEDDFGNVVSTAYGGFLFTGNSYSGIGFDKTEVNLGEEQIWSLKTGADGSVQWDKTVFTMGHEESGLGIETADGCYVFANSTQAGIGGYKSETNFDNPATPGVRDDFWLVKLCSSINLQAEILSLTTKICPDSCIAFGNQSADATSYEWFFQGGNPSYSTDENPTNICYSASGTFDVTLIAHNGPNSDTTVSTNLIQVYAPPSPIIVQSNDTLFASNTTGSDTYQWFYNGAAIPSSTNPFVVPIQNGAYSVIVTSPQGCSGLDATEFTGVGIEWFNANNFILYPNPADQSFTIKSSHQAISQFKLYNTLGQLILNGLVESGLTVDVSMLAPGFYNVVLQSDNDVAVKRFVVHRLDR